MYEIIRLIEDKNREGIDEVFIDVSITDDLGIYGFGHWLTPKQMVLYRDGQINNVIESLLPQARINKIKQDEAVLEVEEDYLLN